MRHGREIHPRQDRGRADGGLTAMDSRCLLTQPGESGIFGHYSDGCTIVSVAPGSFACARESGPRALPSRTGLLRPWSPARGGGVRPCNGRLCKPLDTCVKGFPVSGYIVRRKGAHTLLFTFVRHFSGTLIRIYAREQRRFDVGFPGTFRSLDAQGKLSGLTALRYTPYRTETFCAICAFCGRFNGHLFSN